MSDPQNKLEDMLVSLDLAQNAEEMRRMTSNIDLLLSRFDYVMKTHGGEVTSLELAISLILGLCAVTMETGVSKEELMKLIDNIYDITVHTAKRLES